jgi:hypothetical protein
MKNWAVLVGALALASTSSMAMAADSNLTPEPNFAGTFSLGYEYTDFREEEPEGINAHGVASEVAFVFSNFANSKLNVQVDGSLYANKLSDFENTGIAVPEIGVQRWHAGGVLFWRDPSVGLVGIDGAFGGVNWTGDNITDYRFGGRFEYFASDAFTLGAKAGYVHEQEGSHVDGAGGYYGNLSAKFYPSDHWALTAAVDHMYFPAWDTDPAPLSIWAFTGEAEFDLSDSVNLPVSLYAGGRWADQFDGESHFGEAQGFAGLRFYFGGNSGSLVQKHRSNTLDNLSTPLDRVVNREGT